jgi:GDP/UDP-N,N'-diacetylbacillosamine 2-epimerase (hydrolysing)
MIQRKICIVTGSRAEYGLLYWLMKEINADIELKLQIIATGTHLSKEFGYTYKEIEKEFRIDKKIDMQLDLDTNVGISKSMSIAMLALSQTYEQLKPDIVVLLGDRYEILSAATAAMIARIPIAHIHGGELSEGAIDDSIRHSISKMSHLHFTSTEEYKKRVIQLGENPRNVFNVGAMGIENIKKLKLLTKEEFEMSIDFTLNSHNILITFHPATLDVGKAKIHFNELLSAIDELEDTNFIFTKANSDSEGRIINEMIDNYVLKNNHKAIAFISMGQLKYLSAIQFMDAVVGNSSSGLIEVPSFNVPTINIGDRQKGRIKGNTIIDVLPKRRSIKKGFKLLYSKEFKLNLKKIVNPYDQGNTSKKIIKILKSVKLDNILKKSFYNVDL